VILQRAKAEGIWGDGQKGKRGYHPGRGRRKRTKECTLVLPLLVTATEPYLEDDKQIYSSLPGNLH
jgi:hypothetical protein